MPFNLLKIYNQHLEIAHMNDFERKESLMRVFNRDIANNDNFIIFGKQITPTHEDGEIKMSTLFTHLTTEIIDKATKARGFDISRACRLHWVKHHIVNHNQFIVFSVKEPEGIRTYLYNQVEKYVIILEPLRDGTSYYLITAYHLTGRDNKRDKIMKKQKRKLDKVH